MPWGFGRGKRFAEQQEIRVVRQGLGFGRGRGRCWQILYSILKEQGKEEEFEKYLAEWKPCWLILEEILSKKENSSESA